MKKHVVHVLVRRVVDDENPYLRQVEKIVSSRDEGRTTVKKMRGKGDIDIEYQQAEEGVKVGDIILER